MLQELDGDGPHRYAFSFSGLKTAVLRAVRNVSNGHQATPPAPELVPDIARGFQDAAIDVLVAKTASAVEESGYNVAMIGGGVACNRALVGALRERLAGVARLSVASPRLNTDNAAMIAAAGAWRLAQGERSGLDLEPRDDLPLPGLALQSQESRS
jgi:N6-L-threonylcarbamoyladenine synthase